MATAEGEVTTGDDDVAVQGAAMDDENFTGGEEPVRYLVRVTRLTVRFGCRRSSCISPSPTGGPQIWSPPMRPKRTGSWGSMTRCRRDPGRWW